MAVRFWDGGGQVVQQMAGLRGEEDQRRPLTALRA